MQAKIDPAVVLGNELRYARMARHMRQREVATEIGASQSMVSRMELGHGSTMSLATWAAAADAVDRRLVVDLVAAAPPAAVDALDSIERQCHRTVTTTARDGEWTSVTEIQTGRRRERIETTMIREDRSWSSFTHGSSYPMSMPPSTICIGASAGSDNASAKDGGSAGS